MSQLVKDPITGGLFELENIEPSQENADRFFPPTVIGPVWQRDDDGNWLLPEHTLGWEILGWVSRWIANPKGGPWKFTAEQTRLILWIYALDDDGNWLYENIVFQALKGAGKDPLAAVIAIIELIGPCRFSHWDPRTMKPVAKTNPTAWVQVAAVSKTQTGNTMQLIPGMLPQETRDYYNLDVLTEIVHVKGTACKIETVTSRASTLEGNRPSFVILNETQHWVPSQGGKKLYETIRGNVDKDDEGTARMMCITNAYMPGEDSVAEGIRTAEERVWDGLAEDAGWLYVSLEAHPDAPLSVEWTPLIVNRIRGDATWLNLRRITKSMMDTDQAPSRIRRMFYNQIVTAEDNLYTPQEWDAIRDPMADGNAAFDLSDGNEIVLGFDGGRTDDATALVAIRISDKLIVPLGIWEKPQGALGKDWTINRGMVDSAVNSAFHRFKVKAFFADVAEWESWINDWSETYRDRLEVHASGQHAIRFDMRNEHRRVGLNHEALVQTIVDKKIKHNGDKLLRRHALNAKQFVNKAGFISFRKESPESKRKVDAYAATLVAFVALQELIESNKKKKPVYKRRLYQFN